MLDFTKDIPLDPAWRKKYQIARAALYLLFLAGSFYFAYIVLFPSQFFSFTAGSPLPKNNAVFNTEVSENKIDFDVFSMENFSSAEVRLYFEDELPGTDFGTVKVRKTYQAFSYPETKEPVLPQEEKPRFANGSLVSFDNAVFAIDGEQAFPFKDPQTFISMGYDWNDVMPISESELGFPRSNILFTIDRPHPNGTVFAARESGKHFLINNKHKQEIADPAMLRNYLAGNPILADEGSLAFQNSCKLEDTQNELANSYHCSVPVDNLAGFLGNNYQFEAGGVSAGEIKQIEVKFSRKIDWPNLRDSLSKIKRRILTNFGL